MQGIIFYGNLAKAQVLLGCVQASILGVRKDADRGHPSSRHLLSRYVAELEEIESDLVILINEGRANESTGQLGNGIGSPGASGGNVHDL